MKIDINKYNPSRLEEHFKHLMPFFNGIRIREVIPVSDDIEIDLPEDLLPDGYKIAYVRRSKVIGKYTDGDNTLHISEQTLFKTNHILDDVLDKPVFEIFYGNENIDRMLRQTEWEPKRVAEEIEKLLKFTNILRGDIR